MSKRVAVFVVSVAVIAFVAGYLVGRFIDPSVPVVRDLPGIGAKPTYGRVIQDGKTCDLVHQFGMNKGYKKLDETCPLVVGDGFTAGYHTIQDGWKVESTGSGPVLTLTVVNENPGSVRGFDSTFHLNRYDGSLVEIVWCKTKELTAGESRTITCKPLSPEPSQPFDAVEINL